MDIWPEPATFGLPTDAGQDEAVRGDPGPTGLLARASAWWEPR
jgi:hypothetical protein